MAGALVDLSHDGPHPAARMPSGRSWSLRTWLILLVLAATTPLAGFGLFHAVSSYVSQRDALLDHAESMARNLARLTTQELDRGVIGLQTLAAAPVLEAGDFAGFASIATSFLDQVMPGGALLVFDAAGRTLFATGAPAGRAPRRADHPAGEREDIRDRRPRGVERGARPIDRPVQGRR